MFVLFIFGNIFSLFAQSTEKITLEFYQDKCSRIEFPCKDISTCIDTLYYKEDTLSIKLTDCRFFYLDTCNKVRINRIVIICEGYFYKTDAKKFKRQLNIPINEHTYHFVEIQIYDRLYLFKKKKNRYNLESRYNLENKAIAKILQENFISFDSITIIFMDTLPCSSAAAK
jgi:hypothetical protein